MRFVSLGSLKNSHSAVHEKKMSLFRALVGNWQDAWCVRHWLMRARTFSRIISPMTIYYTRYYLLLLLFGDRSVVIFSAFVRMATKREAASPEKKAKSHCSVLRWNRNSLSWIVFKVLSALEQVSSTFVVVVVLVGDARRFD